MCSQHGDYSYEHTVVDARGQEPGARTARGSDAIPASKTRTASDKHRLSRPHPFRGDDRRLDGCQNPLHAVQEPEDRDQEPG